MSGCCERLENADLISSDTYSDGQVGVISSSGPENSEAVEVVGFECCTL